MLGGAGSSGPRSLGDVICSEYQSGIERAALLRQALDQRGDGVGVNVTRVWVMAL